MTKVVAFDVFGTVFNLAGIDRQEIRDYVAHIRKVPWEPLKLPDHWELLPAHDDAPVGIALLRQRHIVVTCSNGPLGLLAKLSKRNRISWDAIIPLELNKVYKPNPAAYMTVCEVLGCHPADVTMVTANKDFGDIEAARALGMQATLIRDPASEFPTITSLAWHLTLAGDQQPKPFRATRDAEDSADRKTL